MRTAYLLRRGLDRDAFVGSNVASACLVDVARLLIDRRAGGALTADGIAFRGPVALCAFLGRLPWAPGSGPGLRRVVALTMVVLGLAIAGGLLGGH